MLLVACNTNFDLTFVDREQPYRYSTYMLNVLDVDTLCDIPLCTLAGGYHSPWLLFSAG